MLVGNRTDNPANGTAKAVSKAKTTNHKAVPFAKVAAALDTVRSSDAWDGTKDALEFLTLTATRSGEVRGAVWSEVDLGACPRIRSWRRKTPRNSLCTAIWTLSWSN